MSAETFINRLEQKGLLDQKVVNDLRRRIAKSRDRKITPEAVAKFLVDKGHLTAFQATKLVNEAAALQERAAAQGKQDAKPSHEALGAGDPELQFAPDSDAEIKFDRSPPTKQPAKPDVTAQPPAKKEKQKPSAFKQKPKRGGEPTLEIAEDDLLRIDDGFDVDEKPEKKKKPSKPAADRASSPPSTPPPAPTPPPPPVSDLQTDLLDAGDDLAALESAGATRSGAHQATHLDGLLLGSGTGPATPRRLQPTSQWDSKLLLIGGATLGVLIVLGAFLVLSLTRGSADEILSAANEDYNAGAYASAMKRYDQFLKYYSGNDNASHAHVFRNLARLRQVYTNPQQGLRVAGEILPEIEKDEAFDEARPELASMLPQIAEGFVEKAKFSDDTAAQEQLLDATRKAMQLVDNTEYIPTSLRRTLLTKIDRIHEDMARVQREIDRERNLESTIAAIHQAVTEGKTNDAYAARQALLDKYPGLDTNERLYQAVLKITEKQRERVRIVDQPLPAATDDHPGPPDRQVLVLAHQRGAGETQAKGYVTYVLAGGSVFALDAATGNVLWRRYLGFESTIVPEPVSAKRAGADAIVVDNRHGEVQRLDAKTGALRWRLPLGEPFSAPVITDDQIYVAAASGKLYRVDPATGTAARHAEIDQKLEVGPGTGAGRGQIYQPGEHDNLYVLAADTLACREVVYLGHKPGTIVVPPVMALGLLLVVENGPDYALVHILRGDAQGLHLKKAQATIRLRGRVLVPPVVGRRRVLFMTDRRALELYDVDPNNQTGTPLMETARRSATAEAPLVSYPLMDRGYLWIANNRFTKFQVQAATGKLPAEWVKDEQDVYVAPLRMVHDLVIHTRRRQGTEGVIVGATPLQGKDPVWQTELTIPILRTMVDQQGIHAITGRGRLFNLDSTAFQKPALNRAARSAVKDDLQTLLLDSAVDMGQGQWAFTQHQGYTQIVFYKPATPSPTMRLLTLTVPRGDATNPPVAFAKGVLVPQRPGLIGLMDVVTGAERAHPFQPELPPGTKVQWTRPAIVQGADEFVVANDQRYLYRVGLKPTPQPHLTELKSVQLAANLVGRMAVTGALAFGVTRGASGDVLQGFKLPNLEQGPRITLKGHVHWGPMRVENVLLVATDHQLLCVEPDGRQRWQAALESGPPVGTPTIDGAQLLLASAQGVIWRLDLASGKMLASSDAGEPVASGPVLVNGKILVAGKSGTLIVVPNPAP